MIGLSRNSKAVEYAQMQADEIEDREEAAPMGRRLTDKEWAKMEPPFIHYRPEMPQWGSLEYEIAQNFIASRAIGWWYYRDKRFVFETDSDAIMFKLWAKNEPMSLNKVLEFLDSCGKINTVFTKEITVLRKGKAHPPFKLLLENHDTTLCQDIGILIGEGVAIDQDIESHITNLLPPDEDRGVIDASDSCDELEDTALAASVETDEHVGLW